LARTLGNNATTHNTTTNNDIHIPRMSNIVNPAGEPVVVNNHNGGDLSTAPTTSTTISPISENDNTEDNTRLSSSPSISRRSSHRHHLNLGLGHHNHNHQDATNDENPHPHRKPSSVVKRMTTGLFTPEKKIKRHPGWKTSFVNLAKSSWINLLLVFIPVS
jgi:hypothetical protein